MYCYQGKEHFCSILFTSQKPENGKTTLVECLLGDPENSELMLSYCFLSFLKKKKKDEQMWISEGLEGKKRNSSSYRSLVSWIDTILGGISTFLSVFPKGAPPGHLIDISLSEAPRCIPSKYLQMKRQAQTASLCLWSPFFWFVLC